MLNYFLFKNNPVYSMLTSYNQMTQSILNSLINKAMLTER